MGGERSGARRLGSTALQNDRDRSGLPTLRSTPNVTRVLRRRNHADRSVHFSSIQTKAGTGREFLVLNSGGVSGQVWDSQDADATSVTAARILILKRPLTQSGRSGGCGPKTQALYRKLRGARHSGYDLSQIAASLSIEAFEGSRWRLRRTRQQTVCGFNRVLVLKWDAAEDLDQGRKRHSEGCERVMSAF